MAYDTKVQVQLKSLKNVSHIHSVIMTHMINLPAKIQLGACIICGMSIHSCVLC